MSPVLPRFYPPTAPGRKHIDGIHTGNEAVLVTARRTRGRARGEGAFAFTLHPREPDVDDLNNELSEGFDFFKVCSHIASNLLIKSLTKWVQKQGWQVKRQEARVYQNRRRTPGLQTACPISAKDPKTGAYPWGSISLKADTVG